MGIKDWFGGDKKKEALREKVKDAVSDGRLSSSDVREIEEHRQELGAEDIREDKTVIRKGIYNEAVAAVKKDGEVTATDQHELARIQKYLALRDDQIEKTRWDLARLRRLTEIRMGNLPTVTPGNAALRGIQFEEGEIAHYSLTVDLFDQPTTRGADGVQAEWGKPYESGAARVHVLPESGAKPIGEGVLVLTNRRVVVKTGSRVAAIKYAPDAQIYVYSDGLRLQRTIGNTLLKFRSGSEETGEIVAELLAALMK